jgi:hypothetical protein
MICSRNQFQSYDLWLSLLTLTTQLLHNLIQTLRKYTLLEFWILTYHLFSFSLVKLTQVVWHDELNLFLHLQRQKYRHHCQSSVARFLELQHLSKQVSHVWISKFYYHHPARISKTRLVNHWIKNTCTTCAR